MEEDKTVSQDYGEALTKVGMTKKFCERMLAYAEGKKKLPPKAKKIFYAAWHIHPEHLMDLHAQAYLVVANDLVHLQPNNKHWEGSTKALQEFKERITPLKSSE